MGVLTARDVPEEMSSRERVRKREVRRELGLGRRCRGLHRSRRIRPTPVVVVELGAKHVVAVLGHCDLTRARGPHEITVTKDIAPPLGTTEVIVSADCCNKVSPVVEGRLGNSPPSTIVRSEGVVRMLDTDGRRVRITGVPGSVPIVDKLANTAILLDLVVCRCLSALPDIVATLNSQVACIVMEDDLIDRGSPSRSVVLADDHVDISFKSVPILHCLSFCP